MIKQLLLVLVITFTFMLFALPHTAGAFDAYRGVDCSGAQARTAVCGDKNSGNPIAGPNGILLKITNIVAYIAGAAAIIVILVSAVRFITSGSDISTNTRTDNDVEAAKATLANALIGLAVIVLAKLIVTYVVKRL